MFRSVKVVSIILATLALVPVHFALSQDYIDVEGERRAGRQVPESSQSPDTGAVSYGLGGTAAVTTTLPPPTAPGPGGEVENVGGLFNQVQQLQNEVMRLNGVVEQLSYELRELREQSLERYIDLDQRVAQGGVVAGPAAPGDGQPAEQSPRTPATTAPELPGEGEAYRAAYALVRGQEFDQAVGAFQSFLERYPDGRYAPNAHYWLGELYLVVQPMDAEAARQSFMLLLSQYPDNAKVPDALFKLGRVHYIKGNSARAREFLDRVVREYPSSAAARLASDFRDQNL